MKNILCVLFIVSLLSGCGKTSIPGKVQEMGIGDFFALDIPAKFPTIVLLGDNGEITFYSNSFVNEGDFERIITTRPESLSDSEAAANFEKVTVDLFNQGKVTSKTIIYLTSGDSIEQQCPKCEAADKQFADAIKALNKEDDVLLLQLN